MEKPGRYNILFYLLLILSAMLPLTVSRYFFNINDLPKSSVLILIGGFIIVITLSLLIIRLFKEKSVEISYNSLIDPAVIIFLLSIIISTVFSLRPLISFYGQYERQFGLITYLFIGGLFFIAGSIITLKQKKSLLLVMEIVSVLTSVYAVLQILHADPFGLQPVNVIRPVGTLGNAVFLGGFLILSFPFSLFNVSEKRNKAVKIAFPAIIFAGIIVTGTRSAYIALAIQLLLVYLLFVKGRGYNTAKNRKQIIAGLILSVIPVFAFMLLYNDSFLVKRIYNIFNFNNPRLILWQDSIKVFLNYPLTGCGIGMFPAALEEVYSNTLRYTDALSAHDHAHSNYLHILCTAGIIGFIAYLFLLISFLKSAVLSFRKMQANTFESKISIAVIIMIAGYAFYGLTNFDDISVTFYLFMFFAVFRSVNIQTKKVNISVLQKIFILIFTLVIAAGCVFSGFGAFNNLQADRFFLLANVEYGKGEFTKGLEMNNRAIMLNPGCSAYRYKEASEVYNFCFDNNGLKPESKKKLLLQVEEEISKAKENLYYINYCNGLLSLVYYESGRKEEAEKLKEEVLVKDSMNINYRIMLARYLLKENRLDEAFRSIMLVLLVKPKDIKGRLLAAIYYRKIDDKDNAISYSGLVLNEDPQNIIALNILKDYGLK